MGIGPRALLYRLRCLLKRREVDVWYDPAYRLPFTGVEFSGLDPRRADFAAWWLRQSRAIAPGWWRTPRRASFAELSRVHDTSFLESMARPATLAAVFGVDPSDVPVDEVMRTVRLATGGTIQAAGEALRRNKPQLNLVGGFHHAGPASAGGFCPVNDIAAAIASVRADGFTGMVAVLDLDAHPPDGIAACLVRDPNHWIGSISGSTWGPLAGVDEVVLPEGTGDGPYLETLRALLDRMPPAGLVFVIAGGDVLHGDRLGKLDLTLDGTRRRNVAVAAHLEGVPSVWLPGGGYSKNAWKALAGIGLALSTGSLDPIPESYDPIGQRFSRIAAKLDRAHLSDSGDLTDSDLAEALGLRPTRQRLLLGFYTEVGIEFALQRFGILDQLRRLGYDHFRAEFGQQHPGERIRIYGEAEGKEHVLLELVLERKRVAGHPVLYVHWLSLRHPKAVFSLVRPRLPGQEVPGLGLARETGEMLALMALRLELTGVAYRPAHFHTAFAGRHHFAFVDAAREGRFQALVRDLKGMPLLDATRAIDEGRVLLDGKPYAWEPDEMVMWLREHPEERGEEALEQERCHFTVLPAAAPSPPASPPARLAAGPIGKPRP